MMISSRTLIVTGFALTALGSFLGILGALMQANAYFPFKIGDFVVHICLVFRKAITKGVEEALNQVRVTTKLGAGKGEDRAKSLIGLYLVFCGFFMNLLGAFLALLASLVDSAAGK